MTSKFPSERAGAWKTALSAWFVSRAIAIVTLEFTRRLFDDATGEQARVLARGLRGWDASYYVDIAASGYDGIDHAGIRFFPLLPLLGRSLAAITPLDAGQAVVVVANLAALLAFVAIHRLVSHEFDDRTARAAVWITALAPPAFVLTMGYAEPLLLLASASALLAARRRRWGSALAWSVVAGLARPTGLLLAVPIALEAISALRDRSAAIERPKRMVSFLAVLGAPLGVLAFLVAVQDQSTSLLEPLRLHDDPKLRGSFRNPLSSVIDAFGDLVSGERYASGIHFVTVIVVVWLLVVLWRRAPRSFFAYGLVSMLVATSVHNLDSIERYSLATVPFVVAAALVVEESGRGRWILGLSAAAMVGLGAAAFAGNVVP